MVSNDNSKGNKGITKVNSNNNETYKDLRSNSFKPNSHGEANGINNQPTEHIGNNVEQAYSNVKTNENEIISTFDDGANNQRSKIYSQGVEKEINNENNLSQHVNKFSTKKDDLNYHNINGKKSKEKNIKKQGNVTKKRKISKRKEETKKEENYKPEINEVTNNENHE